MNSIDMAKRTSHYPMDAMFKGLKTLLTSLPSEKEKSELIQTLSEAQSFLKELQQLVETVPTTESSRKLSEGLSRLDILAERAYSDVGLRRLLGLRGTAASKTKRGVSPEDAELRSRELEQKLTDTETSDVEEALKKSGEPMSVLTNLATLLGMRTLSKERKADLIKRIAVHIENQRGYSILRGEKSELVADNLSQI